MLFCLHSRPISAWKFLVLLLGSLPALGQVGPSIKPKDSRYDVCLREGTARYTVTILLDVPAGSACALQNFKLDWGDNKVDDVVYDPAKLEFAHEYDVKDFVDNCRADVDRTIKFKQTDNCGTGNPANSSFDITFRNTPRPRFTVSPVCAGQQLRFTNQTCPVNQNNVFSWTYGDTSPPSPTGVHTYAASGTYTATLSVSGVCGSSGPFSAPVQVLDKALAAIKDSGATAMRNDTSFICLAGGATIRFDGTSSTGATAYTWDISGPAFPQFLDRTNRSSPNPKVKFTQPGDYIVTLTVDNPCGIPNRIKCVHRVLDLPTPTLKPQNDTCEAFTYKVANPLAGATYTLNGTPFNPTVGVPLSLTSTPYTVAVTTQNVCGSNPVMISFVVNTPGPVRITSLPRTSTVCVGTTTIALQADRPGGSWTLKNASAGISLSAQNNQTMLTPGGVGTVRVLYRLGSGRCAVVDSVDLVISGAGVSVNDLAVCASQTKVKLPGSPAGGTWSTRDCQNCIQGDSLVVSTLTVTRLSVTYQVSNAGGCQASATFAVTVGQPKAVFSVAGSCSNKPVVITNTSTGAATYSWLVNGVEKATGQTPTPALSLLAGMQTLTLRASAGSCSNEVTQTITLIAPPTTLLLTPDRTSGCAPLAVTFGPSGMAQPGVDYRWQYGDGTTANVFSAQTHTYTNPGQTSHTYTATLTATNTCGTMATTTALTVRPLAFAEIGVDSTTVRCTPATLRFSNRSAGEGQTSTWDFGDGLTRQTAQDTILHRFSARDSARTYRVTLIVQNTCGRDTDAVNIRVYPTIVRALFTLSTANPCANEAVQFTDASVPRPTSWIWKFSDGTVETTPNPVHRFADANKTYSVLLIATTPCGYDSLTRPITTTIPPTAKFQVPTPFICNAQPALLTNLSNPANRFRWDFGDGSPVDSVNFSPRHVFPASLTSATVRLTVFGSSTGCSASVTQPVAIRPALKPTFSVVNGPDICSPGQVQLSGTDPNAKQFRWTLSNGLVTTDAQPQFADLPPGQYGLTLTVGYENGTCPDSASQANAFRVVMCQAVAPDAFTPNGDRRSDTWTLFGDDGSRIARLRIWNRWGEVIFEAYDIPLNSETPGECWDGTNGGVPMPGGQYPYEADVLLRDSRRQKYTGSIALMR